MDTEFEHGSYVPKPRRRHNGYYAGDFSQTHPCRGSSSVG